MSKIVNITVSASISTDFFIEVPDNADEAKIKELAKKEVVLPIDYPQYLDNFLRTRMGIQVKGIDSMLKSWNIDELEYLIEDSSVEEQLHDNN